MAKRRRPSPPRSRPQEPAPTHQRSNGPWLCIAALILAGAAVYANSVSGPFTFDDVHSVIYNDQIKRLWPLSDVLALRRQDQPVAGRPLVALSLAVNYALGGLDVLGYHLGNIALHIACALLLFGVIRRTLLRDRFSQSASVSLAFLSALVWIVHPLQTETVNYISARTESMMGVFYLLTLYAGVRAAESPRPARWLVLAVVSCSLGMACKEVMMTAPIIVPPYDRTFLFGSLEQALRTRWHLYLGLVAGWALLGLLLSSGARFDAAGFTTEVTPWTNLLNQATIVVRYLQLAIWPRSLVFDYGEPQALTLRAVAPQAALLSLLLVLTGAALVWRPTIGFLGAWVFIILAPTSSFVPIATEVGAERRMYLPLAAIIVFTVVGGYQLAVAPIGTRRRSGEAVNASATAGRSEAHRGPAVATTIAAAVVLGLAAATISRNADYRSGLALWTTVLDRWPRARAYRNVGAELSLAGRHDEALPYFREAAIQQPAARYSLGYELFTQGKFDEAVAELRRFVRERPDDDNIGHARGMIANALASQGKLDDAAHELRQLLVTNPDDADAQLALADTLLSEQKFEEARTYYQQVLRSKPASASTWSSLAIALAASGQPGDAAQAFNRALALDPQSGRAHRDFAGFLLHEGDINGATTQAQEAVRLTPRDPAAHNLLGLALAAQMRFADAIAEFKASLDLEPTDNAAQEYLARTIRLKESLPHGG